MGIYAIINYIGPIIGIMIILIGAGFVIIFLIFKLIILVIRYMIKYITRFVKQIYASLSRAKNKQLFLDKLISTYHISLNRDDKINKKLLVAVDKISTKHYSPTELNDEFKKLKESIKISLNQASIWENNEILSEYSYRNDNLSRNRLHYTEKGFLNSTKHLCPNYFTIKSNGIKLHFFPYFIITEINCEYNLITFTDVSIINKDTIYVEESSNRSIKGATPAYYNYLHQRIDGGPDRRYKDNPSTPVYKYDIFKLCIGKEIQVISASSISTLNIIDSIKKYQCEFGKYPTRSLISVKGIDISRNEYADLIKGIIDKHGKEFILSKSFINYFKDYRISNQYSSFIPILEIMQQSSLFADITQEDYSYEKLDTLKNTIKQSTAYSELEIATVLALIGYGVQLKA